MDIRARRYVNGFDSLRRQLYMSDATNSAAPAGSTNRFAEVIGGVTLTTRLIISLCSAVYVYQLFYPEVTNSLAICPYTILYLGLWRTLVTSAFAHGGILHLAFNMMSVFYLGIRLERAMGTLCLFFLSFLFVVLEGTMYFTWYWLLTKVTGDFKYLTSCAVGYSGVIFAYIVIDVSLPGPPTRSVMGFFAVPKWLFPWASLLVTSLIMPQASFTGHLCGVLLGWLYAKNYLAFFGAKRSWICDREENEETGIWAWLVQRHMYVRCPADDILGRGENADATAGNPVALFVAGKEAAARLRRRLCSGSSTNANTNTNPGASASSSSSSSSSSSASAAALEEGRQRASDGGVNSNDSNESAPGFLSRAMATLRGQSDGAYTRVNSTDDAIEMTAVSDSVSARSDGAAVTPPGRVSGASSASGVQAGVPVGGGAAAGGGSDVKLGNAKHSRLLQQMAGEE
jgi:membrane associated rhomboid family serine protease